MAVDWLDRQALWLPDDPWTLPAAADCESQSVLRILDERIAAAKVLVLGETNHFIREKTDFRLTWLRWLKEQSGNRHRQIVIGEELGWADGRRVAAYLSNGEPGQLAAAATFGGRQHERDDRDDAPRGVFAESLADYPHDAMRRAHARFYAGLRDLGLTFFFGFDVDAAGCRLPRHRTG